MVNVANNQPGNYLNVKIGNGEAAEVAPASTVGLTESDLDAGVVLTKGRDASGAGEAGSAG